MAERLWHHLTVDETLHELGANPQGLSPTEAAERLTRYGPNRLQEAKGISPWQILLAQFKNFLILLLIAATVISLVLGHTLDAIIIFSIVILSALLGFYQEFRAERAMEALKAMASPTASVVRGGEQTEIASAEVVPGDIILLAAGDRVPADARLLEVANLQADEASLTGESTAVEKVVDAELSPEAGVGDRLTMVFSGTVVTYGRGRGVVTATGMQTEFGKIAKMLQDVEEEPSPLAVKMDYIGKRLGIACLAVSAVVVGLGILRGNEILEMFIWGVSLAIAAVPEALAAVVTGALAIGVQRAARRNAIIRHLPAVETLGCTSVICSDKTGTLTKNEMTIRKVFASGRMLEVTGVGYDPAGEFRTDGDRAETSSDPTLVRLLQGGALCNDTHFIGENGSRRVKGDPTEAALVVVAEKADIKMDALRRDWPRVAEIPFESERKRMTTVHAAPGGSLIAFVKGAPDILLDRCVAWERNGTSQGLTDEMRRQILDANDGMARQALRVLGIAYRRLDAVPAVRTPDTLETDLVFLGLVGMIDPPRDEARAAIRSCREAGIRSVMVTGDHKLTAAAVARELGLLDGVEGEGHRVLDGRELDRMSESELAGVVEQVAVYARVSPEHKLKIVGAWKSHQQVVAMTGDGVNDAPALKRADIGVAMGITGTDVTKEACDMVLTDDNFATIAAAVEEGRIIYDNIKKYLVFLLSCNVSEIVVLGMAGFIGWPLPLVALQILWVNLTTDGLPALALGVEPAEPDLMRRAPRKAGEGVFSRSVLTFLLSLSLIITAGLVPIFYFYWQAEGLPKAQTMTFASMILFELFFAHSCRSLRFTVLQIGLFGNKWLWLATIGSALMMFAVVYVDAWAEAFHLVPLSGTEWAVAVAVAGAGFLAVETGKWVVNRRRGSRA
ncbi:MAG TPA: cation-translocating P-type ATPase [Candidatus Methylomirabilis sp.]|nr:cation-translocating P-type ATPase [Candidatus Methylomirabilis sp.]